MQNHFLSQILEVTGFVVVLLIMGLVAWFFLRPGPYDIPRADWKVYKRAFIHSSGRVVDTGNGNASHSEGQGYGMLFAVAFKDRSTFDKIWKWTREHLQTREEDKLLSWAWKPADKDVPEGVSDPNNASDGDLLVAWALLRAHELWGAYAYKQAAAQILSDLKKQDVIDFHGKKILLPGTYGFREKEGKVTVNPSYYVFPALTAAHRAFPSAGWNTVIEDGVALIKEAQFGSFHLSPDWLEIGESPLISPDFPPDFGYNAVRIPLHIAWDHLPPALLTPFAEFWKPRLSSMPSTVNLETDVFGQDPALPGMQAIAQFTIASFGGIPLQMSKVSALDLHENYFSASLKLLTKLAIHDRHKASVHASTQ